MSYQHHSYQPQVHKRQRDKIQSHCISVAFYDKSEINGCCGYSSLVDFLNDEQSNKKNPVICQLPATVSFYSAIYTYLVETCTVYKPLGFRIQEACKYTGKHWKDGSDIVNKTVRKVKQKHQSHSMYCALLLAGNISNEENAIKMKISSKQNNTLVHLGIVILALCILGLFITYIYFSHSDTTQF
eukprot:184937_1